MLGQLQDKVSTKALASTLKDTREHPMVRHEAAEALGSIAGIAYSCLHVVVDYGLVQLSICLPIFP